MGYIKRKEGNLLVPKALFNGHWQNMEKEVLPQTEGNLAYLPHHKNKTQKEVWMGHGAVASVLLIFCGLFMVQNMKDTEEDLRGLASDPLTVMEEKNSQDDHIVADLNSGRRELSSVNDFSLEEKEYFEHTVFNSYYVSFSTEDTLSEVQLRSEKTPIYIKDHREFIQNNRKFFPEYSQIQTVEKSFDSDKKLKTSVYRMIHSSEGVRVSFQTDEQDFLISILVENEE